MTDLESVQQQLALPEADKKIHALHQLQQLLAQSPEISEPEELTSLLKASLRASNAHLSYAALACLPAYFPLLVPSSATSHDLSRNLSGSTSASSQRPASPSSSSNASHPHGASHAHTLKNAFVSLLSLDKLSDSKEKVREAAREAAVSAARTALRLGVHAGTGPQKDKEGPWGYLETKMAEQGFHGKSAKAREQALHYLVAIRDPAQTSPLAPLKPFTILLLPLLGDPDPTVRSLALSSTITIFSASGVSQPAKADLKKAMIKLDVGKKVQDSILAAVLGGAGPLERTGSTTSASDKGSSTLDAQGASSQIDQSPPLPRSRPRPPSPNALAANLPSTAFPTDPSAIHAPTTDVQPVYIADTRDLQLEFERMKPGFEGKESEHNWMIRDKSIARIRGMVKGGVADKFLEPFMAGLKSVQEGILKTASSLRTTVAVSALSLISELSCALKHSFDHCLDYYLSHTLSMAGQTKKIVANASQETVTTLITNSGYHHRTLQLLRQGMDEKTASARVFVSGHVGTFVKVHGRASKHAIEATGGVEEIEQSVKKGLSDANPQVKENSRATFWAVKDIWPKMGDRIMGNLDATSKKQLEKSDPSRKGSVEKPVATKTSRPSVRELMMQAKRQAATGTDPGPALESEPSSDSHPEAGPQAAQSPPLRASTNGGKIPTPRGLVSPASRSVSSPSTPTATRPNPATSAGGSSQRVSRQLEASATPPSPPFTPQSDAQEDNLVSFSSPFASSSQQRDGSLGQLSSAPSSPSSGAARGRMDSLILPITEPIVDEALRDQAKQAEQAAERLLELAEEEEEGSLTSAAVTQGSMRTPVSRKVHLLKDEDVFEDSPDSRSGEGAGATQGKGNWWMRKVENVPAATPLPPDSAERTQEIATLISALQSRQIDSAGLKKLAALSKERPVRDVDATSPLESPSHARNGDKPAQPFWEEDRRFARMWQGLSSLLLRDSSDKDPALVLLKALVQYQAPCFAGDEVSVFSLLLQLREDPSRTTIAAVEGIADVFVSQAEPLFALGSLCSSLASYLPPGDGQPCPEASAKSFALGLRLIGKFFERLPAEVLEDEVPRRSALIKRGLNDAHSGDLRRAAVNALVSAQSVIRDEQRLFEMVGGLSVDQLNLLSYYISKLPPA